MVINELHIAAFGGLIDRDFSLDDGLNIIEGANESGKSSAAMFIKFVFYGLSGKSTAGAMSERKKYVNLQRSMAAGYLICTEGDTKYRVERNLTVLGEGEGNVRETVRIVNLSDGSVINETVPGEYFFGVNESTFVNTVFVGQLSHIRPDGEGLGGAVENMLSSADENVNLKKAADRINTARREIQHKNGGGGEIGALREERAVLEDEYKAASASSAEQIEVEASLADALQKKEQLEKRKEKLDGIFKALDVILVKKKLDAVTHTEAKIEKLRESVEKIDQSGFLDKYKEKLDAAEQSIRLYRESMGGGAAQWEDEEGYSVRKVDGVPTEEDLDDAFYFETKSRFQFAVALAMLIAAVLGLVGAAALYYYNMGSYLVPLFMTAICSVIGVIFFLVQHRTLNDLYDILDEWNVETVDDLEDLADGYEASDDGDYELSYSEEPVVGANSSLKQRNDEAERVIFSMAEGIGSDEQEDPFKAAAEIREYGEKLAEDRKNMQARMDNFIGRLSVLKEQVASVDAEKAEEAAAAMAVTPYGKLALSLDNEGIKKVIRERDFTHGAYQSQLQRVAELERALAELKGKVKSPAETASRMEEIDDTLAELELKRDGYNLAMNALKKAGEHMRSNVVPQLTSYASDIMSRIADGKYDSLILNPNFEMNYLADEETRSVEHMSKGTYDAAYLALRLALMRVMFKKAMPPVVMDESFAYVDETRLVRFLEVMSELDGQSIFFTCRERETVEANNAKLPYNLIRM